MSSPTFVQDYAAITTVLNKYIEGGAKAKSVLMQPAFNPQATMFGLDDKGALVGGPIEGLFTIIDTAFTPSPKAQSVIARIDIVGTAASARVDTNDISGFCFTDFFNLLKVNGAWTIVNKIYHTHS